GHTSRSVMTNRIANPFWWGALLLLLALTLGWKLAVRVDGSTAATDKDPRVKVAEFLERQHFSVDVSEQAREGQPAVRATAGACHLLVANSPPMGWDRDMIRRYATAADRVFVVFDGRVYAEQPTFMTVLDALWSRLQRELGLRAAPRSVFAVIA